MSGAGRIPVAVVGATGMVGQRFLSLLDGHPLFEVVGLAASARSAGMTYGEAAAGRWVLPTPPPAWAADLVVTDASDVAAIASRARLIFCAVDLDKTATRALEEAYARAGVMVVSNNSAHRGTPDVPMIIPEINLDHLDVLDAQRKRLATTTGGIVVKPNCSIQSYVPALEPLRDLHPRELVVGTYQAVSGAGRTLESWPEMAGNVIPHIGGEEEKSEREPLKIWGAVRDGKIVAAAGPVIAATCVRVPVADGHLATVSVRFERGGGGGQVWRDEVSRRWAQWRSPLAGLDLPTAPERFLHVHAESDRPQPVLDADSDKGMAIHLGRLRSDPLGGVRFVSLSHNTLRGAAGGALLTAEAMAVTGRL